MSTSTIPQGKRWLADNADRLAALQRFRQYGPDYRRGVSTDMDAAIRFADQDATTLAECMLRKAECKAGLRHYSTVAVDA